MLRYVQRKDVRTGMAATRPSIRIVKSFLYRGGTKEFSNRYYFNGGAPVDSDAWHLFMDAVVALEKNIYTPVVTITGAFGYEPPSDVAVASKAYTQAGTFSGGIQVPGDCAAVLRHQTSKRSSKNHPVYVFSYFHGVQRDDSDKDLVQTAQRAAMVSYGLAWRNGISSKIRATPDGSPVTGHSVDQFIGHRDFPR